MSDPAAQPTALDLGQAIEAGKRNPVEIVESCLARIAAAGLEAAGFVRLTPARARAEAAAAARRAAAGLRRSPLDGVPVSWKDLFDTAGTPTEGGSPQLAGRIPARDAEALRRAGAAGLVCLGKTLTVEFALGGIGTNPHFGTPRNAAMTDVPRVPGGSSAGAAVSVAGGHVPIGIGSDTGGSVRIPAAWNRLVGFKTGTGAVPRDGVLPLSPTLDTVGPLCRTVADAAGMFAVLAGDPAVDLASVRTRDLRLLAATNLVLEEADPEVVEAVPAVLETLRQAGASVVETVIPEFTEMHDVLQRHGGIVTAEGYVSCRRWIDGQEPRIDPDVLARMQEGRAMSAVDFLTVRDASERLAGSLSRRLAGWDALVHPTLPILPPPMARMAGDRAAYARANALALRNTRLGNVLRLAAVTLPVTDSLPVGFTIARPAAENRALLCVAAAVEKLLAGRPSSV